jgi:hypothetical protein
MFNMIVIGLILGVEICVLPMSHKYIVKYIGFDFKNIIMWGEATPSRFMFL